MYKIILYIIKVGLRRCGCTKWWQYAKEDDVLARCWYVKWWDRFSHTDSIINNVERDFLASHVSPLKITTPVQTVATTTPASSSTKNIASSTRSKKKSSPLDAIRNDPDALYALLSKMVKDDETTGYITLGTTLELH